MPVSDANVKAWMRYALLLAERGRGFVEPNPLVGAVVLDAKGQLTGQGWHERYGAAHAEVNALTEAGERAVGGTLIVTLEPCCHYGKTPPCTHAILRSGVKRVFAAMADPFPQVSGGGLAQLRDAGISVSVGVCEELARQQNAPYLKRIATGRPWVHVKWAMTLDGKIATRTGQSRWISCEESRRKVHELRGRMDAILVGRGTVEKDDPLLTARPAGPRVATRVVISASGQLPKNAELRTTARDAPVIVYTSDEGAGRLADWSSAGVEIVTLPAERGLLCIDDILDNLGDRGMTNVLVEGGAGLLGAMLDSQAADEAHVFIASKLIGGKDAPSPVGGLGIALLSEAIALPAGQWIPLGDDLYWHGRLRTS